MKRGIKIAGIIVLVGAVVAGGYLRLRTQPVAAASGVATATVERGTLRATINAAGNIQAHQTADLSFGQSGVVRKLNVKVGDHVKAGDALAQLDTADLDLQLRSAQVLRKNAQAQLAQARNPNTAQDIANARAKLESAQAAYDKVAAGATQAELAASEASLRSAQANYDAAVQSANAADSGLASNAAAFEKAHIALQQAQSNYDKVSWRGDVAASNEAQTLQSATIDYDSARAAYEAAVATSAGDRQSQVASAAASLQSAQANLSKLKNQVTEADLASARATLTQAKNDLDTLLAGPDANSLDIAQNGVESAEIALDQARLKLSQAQVVAPFDGVITAVSAKLGQAASGAAMTLADLDHLEIVVNMAEVDVNRARAGQDAEITLDAVADATLKGQVSQIAPAGTTSQGVVNYPVTIVLTEPTASVKTGMTANLNIVVDQRDDVLTVPNRAVRTVGRQKMVTVLFEGQQIQVPVQTGLSSDSATEIVSGLQEGDTVVLTATTTRSTSGGMGGPMGGAMGGPPPGM